MRKEKEDSERRSFSVPMDIPLELNWGADPKKPLQPVGKRFPFTFSSMDNSSKARKRKAPEAAPIYKGTLAPRELPSFPPVGLEELKKKLVERDRKTAKEQAEADRAKGQHREKDARTKLVEKPSALRAGLPAKRRGIPNRLFRINYIISSYVVLVLNMFLAGLFMVLSVKLLSSIRNDISVKTAAKLRERRATIEECRRNYFLNKCLPEERVPAMEAQCAAWEQCMNSDPARTEVTSALFRVASEALEELLAGISLRTAFICTVVLAVILRFGK